MIRISSLKYALWKIYACTEPTFRSFCIKLLTLPYLWGSLEHPGVKMMPWTWATLVFLIVAGTFYLDFVMFNLYASDFVVLSGRSFLYEFPGQCFCAPAINFLAVWHLVCFFSPLWVDICCSMHFLEGNSQALQCIITCVYTSLAAHCDCWCTLEVSYQFNGKNMVLECCVCVVGKYGKQFWLPLACPKDLEGCQIACCKMFFSLYFGAKTWRSSR